MAAEGFESVWRSAVRHRRVSRQLEPLLREVHRAMQEADDEPLARALESLLEFLASAAGRTDANCTTTYRFIGEMEPAWRDTGEALRAILDDMSGTLHETIFAPLIAGTFEATPEQLLARVKRLRE